MTGKAPRQRTNLPRQRKSVLLRMRWSIYQRLMKLGEPEDSMDTRVERLILDAKPTRSECA